MMDWMCFKSGKSRSTSFQKLWIIICILLLQLDWSNRVNAQCKDQSLCSFMASEGECENDPEYMLQECPKACKNPCLCPGISQDTACDCLVKAKNGYCSDPAALTDCHSTCTQVIHESCPLLPVPADPNAGLSTWSTNYLTTVTEVCLKGYDPVEPENQGKKTCSSGSRWVDDPYNGTPVQCTPVDCGQPPTAPNAFSGPSGTTFGSKADYSCAGGTVQVQGQKTLTCNASALWEGEIIVCKRVVCGQPPSSANATVSVTNSSSGQTAAYTCSVGFNHTHGDTSLRCNSSGLWQGNLIVCTAIDCGPPPSTPNSQVTAMETTYGKKANFTCMDGYIPVGGQPVLTCSASGAWDPNPLVCDKVRCGQPPSAPNTELTVKNTSYGDTANYTCTQGYTYDEGDMILTCGSQGSWEGVLMSCIKVNCGQPPSTQNTELTVKNLSYGDTANYTCTQGYTYDEGDMILTCGSKGSWEGVLMSCIKVRCGQPPSAPNTELTVKNTSYGDTANYTCTQGYTYDEGDMILTCGSQGSWEGVLMSCIINCGQPPSAPNTEVTVKNTSYGDIANYTCTQGYTYDEGDMILTCGSQGSWIGVLMSCIKIDCRQPPPAPNTDVAVNKTSYGDTANYSCIHGYSYEKGDTTLTCGWNGTWVGVLLSCTRVSCGKPPNATNASVNTTGTLYGDTATYTCLSGYTVVHGDKTLKCEASGDWVGVPVTCQKVDCGQPPPAPNTDVEVNKTSYGDTANYTCIHGYTYEKGDTTLTCGWNGTWVVVLLSCTRVSCGKPPNATNAGVNTTGTLYGDTATYTCLSGYTVVHGDKSLKCEASGNWVGVPVTCQKVDCRQPPPAPNTDVEVNKTSYSDTANYTCIHGYTYEKGDTTLTCGWNGTWVGVLLSCTRVSCGKPPNATNASVNTTGTLYGDTATYTCLSGYTVVHGDKSLKCEASGNWVGVPVTCQKVDCRQPPPAPNTDVEVNKTSYGDTANYTCIHGYTYEKGDTTLTCGWNGTWVGVLLSCTRVSCGKPPNATNAGVNTTGTLYGDTATYTCLSGYTVVHGDKSLKCEASGNWVGVPVTCQKVDCRQPPPAPNTDVEVNKTSYSDTANYTCIHGYTYEKGDTTLTCGWNGTWVGVLLSCTRVSCGKPPNATNAGVNTTGTLYGDTATYTCLSGYTVVHGDKILKCEASGDWVGAPITCQKVDCRQPPPALYTDVVVNKTSYGDTANYSCIHGYVYENGDTTLTCGWNGTWAGVLLSCTRVSCGKPPNATNASVNTTGTVYGDTATYTCLSGYTVMHGDKSLKCEASGDWVGVPVTCQKVDCRQPPPAPNTDIAVNKTSYGDTANYSCIHGYAFKKGDTTLTCGWNGTWAGVLLSCTRVSCGKPPNATNASVNTTGTIYGDTATYTCLSGYTVVHGDKSLKCEASGNWVGVPTTCQRVSCGKPPNATNASVNTTGTLYGDTATYTCLSGYTAMHGDKSLKCEASGSWVGVPITCQIIDCRDPPKLPFTDVHVSGTTFNQSANYTCQTGYIHQQGQANLVCGVSGKWTGDALKCKIINCGPPPKGQNLVTSYTSTTFGQKVIYSCSARYKYSSGDKNLTCSQTGNWSGQLMTCVEKDCGVPDVHNSSDVKFTVTTQGSQAGYTCKAGSGRVSGDFKRICQDDETWSGHPLNCNPSSADNLPKSSHKSLDAPVAWAIGVAIFAVLATVIVLCIVVDCGVCRKRPKNKKNKDNTFRKDVENSLPNFHLTTKWKPGSGKEARLIPSSSSMLADTSPSSSVMSLGTKDFHSGELLAKSNNLQPTHLTMSNSQSQLYPPSVSPVTPRTSLSIPNSPSGITLSSLSETTLRNPMPDVGT